MKTKELIKRLNQLKVVHAEIVDSGEIYVYNHFNSPVLTMRKDNRIWLDVDVQSYNSAKWPYKIRAMVEAWVEEYLNTPVDKRGDEKKYRLRWLDDADGSKNYLVGNGDWQLTDWETASDVFTEAALKKIKRQNPRLASAIDAMKEEVHDNDEE